jgi:Undecaprenyl-phosphate glucose phosphotransferase
MSVDAMDTGGRRTPLATRAGGWFNNASKTKILGLVLIFDLTTLFSIGLGSAILLLPDQRWSDPLIATVVIGLAGLSVYLLQRLWAYTIPALGAYARQVRSLVLALVGAFVLVTGLLFLAGVDVMAFRLWLLAWLLGALVTLPLFRLVVSIAISKAEAKGELARRAVIVGGGKTCADLVARLEKNSQNVIRILGIFDDRGDERSPETIGRYRKIGAFDELEHYCRENAVDLLIVALPQTAEDRIFQLMRKLWELPVDVRIAAHASRLKLSKRAYSYIGDVPFLAVFDRPLSDWNAALKAVFDRIVAALALVGLSPLLLLVALAIKLDSKGPVFFRQMRHGFNNEMIGVFKFRSMHTALADANGEKQVTKGDKRVTRVGRFIRKSSIDELPQLFNVLRGELSLVGPRPHATGSKAGNVLYQEVVDGYYARHRMKPGITGWAQINGWRGETDTTEKLERRVEHDLYYIEHWSLPFDLYILAMTPLSLLNTKNAY